MKRTLKVRQKTFRVRFKSREAKLSAIPAPAYIIYSVIPSYTRNSRFPNKSTICFFKAGAFNGFEV